MTTTIGVLEAKNRLSELIDRVAQGESITITRHGKPVARLLPPEPGSDTARARAAIAALREARCGVVLGAATLAELRAEGRR